MERKVRRGEKDGYRMFKAVKKTTWRNWRAIGRKGDAEHLFNGWSGCPSSIQHTSFKQVRDRYTVKELRGMLRMNKIKGRSKLKTKRKIIVALMKM